MATNFGFLPVKKGKRYFISYKSEDTKRIGEITRKLNEMGVPMWYDYGIEKGKKWNNEINRNIDECESVMLFATKTMFANKDNYVRTEFRIANLCGKQINVVWLDDINPEKVNSKLLEWYVAVETLGGLKLADKTPEQIAQCIVTEFHLTHGMTPQPPSPTFASDTDTAGQKKSKLIKRISVIAAAAMIMGATAFGVALATRSSITERDDTLSNNPSASSDEEKDLSVPVNLSDLTKSDIEALGDKYYLVDFGNYKQGPNGEIQPITWRVIDIRVGKVLLLSEKLLDYVPYNDAEDLVTWNSCTLRNWLNNDFFNDAFSPDEQERIHAITIQTAGNTEYNTADGQDTKDRVFALSDEETMKYLSSGKQRIAFTTDYAHTKGYDTNLADYWWLRSPGSNGQRAKSVDVNGNIPRQGLPVTDNKVAVRPAIWVNP